MSDVSEEFKDSPAIAHWFASARHHEDPPELQDALLAVVADFCAFTGKTPEELVVGCFLRKKATGDKFVSSKARVAMNASGPSGTCSTDHRRRTPRRAGE